MSEETAGAVSGAVVADGLQVSNGLVQDAAKHGERRANAEKAMREAMQESSQGAADVAAGPSTPAEAPSEAGSISDDEKPSKPETPEAKVAAERKARLSKFLAAKSEKGETQQLKARLAQLEQATKAQIEEARNAARREVLEQMQRAPKELFQTHGVAPDQLLAAAMEEATQDPVKLLERKYAALETRLQQEAQERARLQQSLQEREQQAVITQQQQVAIQAATDPERFPALAARYGEDHQTLLSEMSRVASDYHARAGHWPTYADVAEYLDEREQTIFARYSQKGSHAGRPGLAAPKPAKLGTSLTAADTTSTTGAAESKAVSHEERLRRARASEAMTLRNAQRRGP